MKDVEDIKTVNPVSIPRLTLSRSSSQFPRSCSSRRQETIKQTEAPTSVSTARVTSLPQIFFNPQQQFHPGATKEERMKSSFFLTQRIPTTTPSQSLRIGSRPVTQQSERISIASRISTRTTAQPAWKPVRAISREPILKPAATETNKLSPPSTLYATKFVEGDSIVQENMRFVKKETERFEAMVLSQKQNESIPDADMNKNSLARSLFQLHLSSQGALGRVLGRQDMDSLRADILRYTQRAGLRMMNLDDLHAVLTEVLKGERLQLSETRILFEFFDTNSSNLVDIEELMEGLRVVQLDDYSMMLNFCRRLFGESKNVSDQTLSAAEIENLLGTVLQYYRTNAELCDDIKKEVDKVMSLVWENCHQGQISVVLLRHFVPRGSRLRNSISEISSTGVYVPPITPPSPDPDAATQDVFEDVSGIRKRHITEPPSTTETATEKSKKLVKLPLGEGNTSTVVEENINVYHPRFRCDKYRLDNVEAQRSVKEPGSPVWFVRNDIPYQRFDGGEAFPMLQDA